MAEKYVYGPFAHRVGHDFDRADLEFYGINHFRPSFEVEIYLNDKAVTPKNAGEKRKSYAGRFSMLGHRECFGDEGHCHVPTTNRRFDDRPSHPLTRAFRRVEVTDALKKVYKKADKLTVTLIVTPNAPFKKTRDHKHDDKLFDITGMQLVTYG